MKKFFNSLLSDSNKVSTKRLISLICLIMFIAYGVAGIVKQFNANFWIFYVSLCCITMWIGFKFMSADKILKYDVIGKLSKFAPISDAVESAMNTENSLDNSMQPEDAVDSDNPNDNVDNPTEDNSDNINKPEDAAQDKANDKPIKKPIKKQPVKKQPVKKPLPTVDNGEGPME